MLCSTSSEFFALVEHLVNRAMEGDGFDARPIAECLCDRLRAFPREADAPSDRSKVIIVASASQSSLALPVAMPAGVQSTNSYLGSADGSSFSALPNVGAMSSSDDVSSDSDSEAGAIGDLQNRRAPFLVGSLQLLRSLIRQTGLVSVKFAESIFVNFL